MYRNLIFPIAVTFRLDSFVRLLHKHPNIQFAESTFITTQSESENEGEFENGEYKYVTSENAPLLSGFLFLKNINKNKIKIK